jgi:hypothetical protein
MGSCPHLFARCKNLMRLRYMRELFAQKPQELQTEQVIVSSEVDALLIAELEEEQTNIDEIRVNGETYLRGLLLEKGDSVWIPVQPGDIVELIGCYFRIVEGQINPWRRNTLVSEFLASPHALALRNMRCRDSIPTQLARRLPRFG